MEYSGDPRAPVATAGELFMVRPDIVFLNHGSFGARPQPVFAEYQRWQRELEAEPVQFLARRLPDLLQEARARLASYMGTEADNLVFVPNVTHGMNIIARSLALNPGDEVLLNDQEYGAVNRTWRFIAEQRGFAVRSQPLPLPVNDAATLIEQLWAGVTERTRLIVISHITSPTALIMPVAAICERAQRAGIMVVVDGAHAPGQIDLALDALGADFYLGNCHKWLCSPVGAGFLYARPDRQALLQPLVVSWGWQAITPSASLFQDYFGWIGTDDPAAWLSVPAAIDFQKLYDWPQVRRDCHDLLAQASDRIAALTGLPFISPSTAEWWGQMRAIPIPKIPDTTVTMLQARLFAQYQIEIPITEHQDSWLVRISVQAYTSPADIDRLVAALSEIFADAARVSSGLRQ